MRGAVPCRRLTITAPNGGAPTHSQTFVRPFPRCRSPQNGHSNAPGPPPGRAVRIRRPAPARLQRVPGAVRGAVLAAAPGGHRAGREQAVSGARLDAGGVAAAPGGPAPAAPVAGEVPGGAGQRQRPEDRFGAVQRGGPDRCSPRGPPPPPSRALPPLCSHPWAAMPAAAPLAAAAALAPLRPPPPPPR